MGDITTVYKQKFSDLMYAQIQQTETRLKGYTEIIRLEGEKQSYDGIGMVEMEELSARYNKVEFTEMEYLRRKITSKRYGITLPIDEYDVKKMDTDPDTKLTRAVVNAMNRQFDRVIAEAAFADVYTGETYSTTLTFAQDNGVTVDAISGLTYEKLLEVKQNFIDSEVAQEKNDRIALVISGAEHTALMKETQLTSGDYSREFVIDRGEITRALGMDIVLFGAGSTIKRPVLNVASSVRDCIVLSSNSIILGISMDVNVEVENRSDYYNTKQVKITGAFGAVRKDGLLIQKLQTPEA